MCMTCLLFEKRKKLIAVEKTFVCNCCSREAIAICSYCTVNQKQPSLDPYASRESIAHLLDTDTNNAQFWKDTQQKG